MTVPHGTRTGYQWHRCRCLRCRAAEATYRVRLRQQRCRGQALAGTVVAAACARRLIRDLLAQGWTVGTLAHALGGRGTLRLRGRGVRRRLVQRLARLVDQGRAAGQGWEG